MFVIQVTLEKPEITLFMFPLYQIYGTLEPRIYLDFIISFSSRIKPKRHIP